jgi:hypothetical protein
LLCLIRSPRSVFVRAASFVPHFEFFLDRFLLLGLAQLSLHWSPFPAPSLCATVLFLSKSVFTIALGLSPDVCRQGTAPFLGPFKSLSLVTSCERECVIRLIPHRLILSERSARDHRFLLCFSALVSAGRPAFSPVCQRPPMRGLEFSARWFFLGCDLALLSPLGVASVRAP